MSSDNPIEEMSTECQLKALGVILLIQSGVALATWGIYLCFFAGGIGALVILPGALLIALGFSTLKPKGAQSCMKADSPTKS